MPLSTILGRNRTVKRVGQVGSTIADAMAPAWQSPQTIMYDNAPVDPMAGEAQPLTQQPNYSLATSGAKTPQPAANLPLYGTTSGYTPGAAAVDPMAQVQGSAMQNLNPEMQAAYQQNVQNMLSGQAFDPYRTSTNEAQARWEANQRGSAAQQANRLGAIGQGMGDALAGQTERGIAQQKFDTMAQLDIGEQQAKERGVGQAYNLMQAEESSRQYNTTTQNSQNREALEQAAMYGSDQDFAAAYEKSTGQKIDPMAVSYYRGQVRTSNEQKLQSGAIALQDQKSTAAGKTFATYATNHLDLKGMTAEQAMQDQGFASGAQSLWESYGGTGDVPAGWAYAQYQAATDPRITNAIVASNYEVDEAVASGAMKAEDGQLLKDFNSQGLTQFLVRDPKTGKVTFDFDKLNSLGNGSGSSDKAGGNTDTTNIETSLTSADTAGTIMGSGSLLLTDDQILSLGDNKNYSSELQPDTLRQISNLESTQSIADKWVGDTGKNYYGKIMKAKDGSDNVYAITGYTDNSITVRNAKTGETNTYSEADGKKFIIEKLAGHKGIQTYT